VRDHGRIPSQGGPGIKRLALLFACILGVVLSSCGSDDNPTAPTTPAASLNGLWIGKYSGAPTTYPTSGYAMLFRADSSIKVWDGADTLTASAANGTYTLRAQTVASTYTYTGGSTFSTTATVNTSYTFLEGTWGPNGNPTGTGRYFVVKQ
jgi:hypothetical protein